MLEVNFTRFRVPMPMFRFAGGELLSSYTCEDGVLRKGDFKPKRLHTAENTVQLVLSGQDSDTKDCACYLDGIYSIVSAEHYVEWLQTYEHMPLANHNIEATISKIHETGGQVPVFLMRNIYVAPEYRLQGIGHAIMCNFPSILKDALKFKGMIIVPNVEPREYFFGKNGQAVKTASAKDTDERLTEMRLNRFLNAAGYQQIANSTTWWYQVK